MRKARLSACRGTIDMEDLATQHIIAHRHNERMLYCLVTKKTLNRDMREIERHISGRHYKSCLALFRKRSERGEDVEADSDAAVSDDSEADLEAAERNLLFAPSDDGEEFEVVPANDSDEDAVAVRMAVSDDADSIALSDMEEVMATVSAIEASASSRTAAVAPCSEKEAYVKAMRRSKKQRTK